MISLNRSALICLCGLAAAADDLPPGVVNTQQASDVSLSPQESLARITVPDGFHVTLFAGEPDVRRPIAFDFDDRGRLWVVENYSHPEWKTDGTSDRIIILEDSNHDGQFDQRTVFWDKGRFLTGLAVGHGGVWIANTPELSFLPDRNHDDVPDSEPIVMLDGFQISSNNVVNNFHWGPDGWLYGAIGLSTKSLVGKPGTPEEGRTSITRGIWRFHPVDHIFEKVAEGMVNPWGADFNEYGDLITSNTVLAHLWHIVPGMYCERRASEQDNPYAYGRIQSITDHLHWGGGGWQDSRAPTSGKGNGKKSKAASQSSHHDVNDPTAHYHTHSVAGGGHAHCGAMIYLGDNWPQQYRGTFFTNNLHGNRVNNDILVPTKSTYVGGHGEDFLFGNDPWFRGMSIKYGPDGGVYISDWHDIGECHDSDGSHRSSGRIYKVVFGQPLRTAVDLRQLSDTELVELQLHQNEWFVRHARRILHQRSATGTDLTAAIRRLRNIFDDEEDELLKLRVLWTRHVVDDLNESELLELLSHHSQHVRRWAVRFLVDRQRQEPSSLSSSVFRQFIKMSHHDTSPKVRLELACALQRVSTEQRLAIAAGLVSHAADATDPYLPLMIWYGIEPVVTVDTTAALQLAVASRLPLVRRYIARRTVDVESPPIAHVVDVAMQNHDETIRLDLLQGMLDALDGRGHQTAPESWNRLYPQVSSAKQPLLRSVAVRLAIIFGDELAITRLRETVLNQTAAAAGRGEALRALLQVKNGVPVEMLHQLVAEDSVLRPDALHALVISNAPSTANVLLNQYAKLAHDEKQDAISVLATRRSFAEALLTAIEDGRVNRTDVSAFALQQLRAFNIPLLQTRIQSLWADDAQRLKKSDQIAHYTKLMSADYMAHGDVNAGRLVFERTCAKCHTLFGEGGTIAPDLTGSGRKKTDYVLSNLIDPSAEIDRAYRLTTVLTTDGRLLSGFMVQQDDTWLVVRTQDARIRVAMKEVEELITSNTSMMPEGMLRDFTDHQVRDLLVYLGHSEQVPLPEPVSGD
ncbi:MAG TPA: c-type cytochrome [Planctomycetes bacterium]|nr:c-type cytochrome [Fuerstiella sp.]HIK94483.1 c-type cytochrome [Planctomycetota bacterium]